MCNVAEIFVQGHMPIMWNVFLPVFLVTLFIAVSSYTCKHKCINSSMSRYIHTYKHTWRVMHDWYRHADKQILMLVCLHTFIHTCIHTHICTDLYKFCKILWTEHWICIDKLSTIAMVFIKSNGNPRCCNLYSNYGLCCAFPCEMATLIPGVLNKTLSHMWLNWKLTYIPVQGGIIYHYEDRILWLILWSPAPPCLWYWSCPT